ncbi:MAG: hypothetical protein COA59_04820 [Colwellia sp.]|nr:MAG: hypothetical protein COA59_04820 [Colwellia sp.]
MKFFKQAQLILLIIYIFWIILVSKPSILTWCNEKLVFKYLVARSRKRKMKMFKLFEITVS